MLVPEGRWSILMTVSQLDPISRSEAIMGVQKQEVNIIKDASY